MTIELVQRSLLILEQVNEFVMTSYARVRIILLTQSHDFHFELIFQQIFYATSPSLMIILCVSHCLVRATSSMEHE
jgi:hypothetical protein